MRPLSRKPRILIILHQESSTPGRLGMRLVERGFDLDIRRPPLGDALPETLDDHAGAIMFGGPMSANDPDEFVKEALGKNPQGRYYGGGREMAGGFEIPMGFFGGSNDNRDYTKLKWELVDAQIKQKLLRLVNPQNEVIHA